MELRDILSLNSSLNSIKKIESYLSTKDINHRDYAPSLAHLGWITFDLGMVSEAFNILYNFLEVCTDHSKPVIYNALIKMYYAQHDYDNALKAIEYKRPFLPRYNKANYYEDLMNYYEIIGNKTEFIRYSLIYLEDDISDERRLKALVKLGDAYLSLCDYHRFKEKNVIIETLALGLKLDNVYLQARYNEAFVLAKEKNYHESMGIVEELLLNKLDDNLLAQVLTLKLELLVALNELRKASIFESEYEKIVDNGDIKTQIRFAKCCVNLYQMLNNNFNFEVYDLKLANLLSVKEENFDNKKSLKKKNNKRVNIDLHFNTKKEDNKTDHEVTQIPEMVKEDYSYTESANLFDKLTSLFSEFIAYPTIRDFLRDFFIKLKKIAFFDEAYVWYLNTCYHYKKERLYDKKNISIEQTTFEEAKNTNEVIVHDAKERYVDILTGKMYQESYRIMTFSNGLFAVGFRALDERLITEKLNYEVLKFVSTFIFEKLNFYHNGSKMSNKYQLELMMLDKLLFGYRIQMDNLVYLSKSLQQKFLLDEKVVVDEFYQYFRNEDLINYRKVIQELTELPQEVQYSLKINDEEIHIKEKLFKNNDMIAGILTDITKDRQTVNEIREDAYNDSISKVFTKRKLDIDLDELIETNKFSLIMLNINDFKKYNELYGFEFGDQLIYAIGMYLKEYQKLALSIYHYDSDRFVLAINDINDKRAIKKHAIDIANYLNNRLKTLNYRVDLSFKMGILRYPTDTTSKNHDEINKYLFSAFSNALYETDKVSIGFYDFERYKKQMFESQLVTHISESIDLNHLKIEYTQVVNLKDKTCDHYIPHLNLTNYAVEEAKIFEVIKRRGMLYQVEKYLIHKTMYELMEMYKDTKRYFSVVFKISEETLKGEHFVEYLLEQLKFFNLPKTAITIYFTSASDSECIDVLNLLTKNEIMVATSNVEILKKVKISYFYYQLPNYVITLENEFLAFIKAFCDQKGISFVVDEVNNQAVVTRFIDLGCYLFSGKIYGNLVNKDSIIKNYIA